MNRETIIEAMARGIYNTRIAGGRNYSEFDDLVTNGFSTAYDGVMDDARAALAAIEAAGVRLVPVEASYDLEFARMADGTIKVGHNPRTEEGGWALVGDVTKAVTAIEAQRDQALRDLDAANQRLSNVFAALAASPYTPGDAP